METNSNRSSSRFRSRACLQHPRREEEAEEQEQEQEREREQQQQLPGRRRKDDVSCLSLFALLFLTYNSVTAIRRSLDDPWTVTFVAVSYADLLLLFLCLRSFEATPEGSPGRGQLKLAVWSLATVLTVMFSYKVADIMPWPVAVVVWAMAAITAGGGFWALFIYSDKQ